MGLHCPIDLGLDLDWKLSNRDLMCRQDFKSNENALFKQINGLQQGAANANKNAKKNKGNMKEAADAAEQIRKWVSLIFKTTLERLYPKLLCFG